MVVGFFGTKRPWRRSSGEAKRCAVGEPGELGGELVALARGRRDGHGEAVVELAGDQALEPADMVDIGDHALADAAG